MLRISDELLSGHSICYDVLNLLEFLMMYQESIVLLCFHMISYEFMCFCSWARPAGPVGPVGGTDGPDQRVWPDRPAG